MAGMGWEAGGGLTAARGAGPAVAVGRARGGQRSDTRLLLRCLVGQTKAGQGRFKQQDAEHVDPEVPVGRPCCAVPGEWPRWSRPQRRANRSGAESSSGDTRGSPGQQGPASERVTRPQADPSWPGHAWWEPEKVRDGAVGVDSSAEMFAEEMLMEVRRVS